MVATGVYAGVGVTINPQSTIIGWPAGFLVV
jgi:hypothetical protein